MVSLHYPPLMATDSRLPLLMKLPTRLFCFPTAFTMLRLYGKGGICSPLSIARADHVSLIWSDGFLTYEVGEQLSISPCIISIHRFGSSIQSTVQMCISFHPSELRTEGCTISRSLAVGVL